MKTALIILSFIFLFACKKESSCYTCKYKSTYTYGTNSVVVLVYKPDTIACDGSIKSGYYLTGDTAVTITCK